MRNKETVILSLAAAAVAGFVAGLLLAPAKGKESRQMLSQKAGELSEEIAEGIQKKIAAISHASRAGAQTSGTNAQSVKSLVVELATRTFLTSKTPWILRTGVPFVLRRVLRY